MPVNASVITRSLPEPVRLQNPADLQEQRLQREALAAQRDNVLATQKLAIKKQQDQQADEEAVRQAFQTFTGPDGPQRKKIVEHLAKTRGVGAAKLVDDWFNASAKEAAEAIKAQRANDLADMEHDFQLLRSAEQPEQVALAKQQLRDKELGQWYGDAPDPKKNEFLNRALMTAAEHAKNINDIDARAKTDRERLLEYATLTANQEDYDNIWGEATHLGVDDDLRAMGLPRQWSPQVVARATSLVRGVKGRDELADKQADNARADAQFAETKQHNRATEAAARAAAGRANPQAASAMDPAFQDVVFRASMNMAAARRPFFMSNVNRMWAEGKTEELKDVVRQAAIEGENVDVKNLVLGRMGVVASLNDTLAILQEMKQKGVPTNILAGTWEDIMRKLGSTSNPEYVALANRLMGTLINYRRSATGAAFGEKEGRDYAAMFPNYKNEPPVNEALIRGLQREMATYDRVYWTHKLGAQGAEMVGVLPTSATTTTTPPPASTSSKKIGRFEVTVE